jgi:hypothetical protein
VWKGDDDSIGCGEEQQNKLCNTNVRPQETSAQVNMRLSIWRTW